MVINVVLITYNHSQYVEEAFLSIINQKMPNGWDMEIIVADDASPDNTLNILKDLASKATVPVKFLPEQPNLGHPKNYQRAFNACEGEYIAILEGDDYWNSPYHLQQHIEFLYQHGECVLSMNRPILFYPDKSDFQFGTFNCEDDVLYITGKDMASYNRLGNLSSCVVRNSALKKVDTGVFELDMDDWLLGLSLAKFGFLCKLKDATSVWRIHSGGQWNGLNNTEKINRVLSQIDKYDKFLQGIYHAEFEKMKRQLKDSLGKCNKDNKIIKFIPPIFRYIVALIVPPIIKNKFV